MILMWYHPKYYKELKRIAKEEEDKRASEQARRRVGGPTSNEPASEELKSLQAYVKKTKKPI